MPSETENIGSHRPIAIILLASATVMFGIGTYGPYIGVVAGLITSLGWISLAITEPGASDGGL